MFTQIALLQNTFFTPCQSKTKQLHFFSIKKRVVRLSNFCIYIAHLKSLIKSSRALKLRNYRNFQIIKSSLNVKKNPMIFVLGGKCSDQKPNFFSDNNLMDNIIRLKKFHIEKLYSFFNNLIDLLYKLDSLNKFENSYRLPTTGQFFL